ncbi:MAG: NAD(+) synthase [Firmicutes bacterium]|nr:NAD(+) synthase [Bacillota bacterium]
MIINVAMCQMNVVPGRPDINTETMLDMIAEAKSKKADIIIFPEMCIPGYLLGDTWEQAAFLKDCEYYGNKIIEASEDQIIIFGNVAVDWHKIGDDGRVRKYNACFIAHNEKLLGGDNFPYPFRIKTLLPNYREFDDERHFFGLRKLSEELDIKINDLIEPVYAPFKGKQIGLGCIMCEDGWTENYSIKPIEFINNKGGVHLNINISSSPFTLGKYNKRNRIFSEQARTTGTPLVYVNNTGIQNNGKTIYSFDGSSTFYNGGGEIIGHCGSPFVQSVEITKLDLTDQGKSITANKHPVKEDVEYIYQTLCHAIREFTTSIGINKVVIGISGGIDSAVTAALYARVLKSDNILLVNMPSKYNSTTTKNLAASLANKLGCLYTVLPIQHVVDETINQIEDTPAVRSIDNTELKLKISRHMAENIQARDRSARLLAAVAAAFGGVFTCNANKTELTVGYSTLYGDQAGFLAALADLWKHQVYELAIYLNKHIYQKEVIPQGIIDLVPSAELSFEHDVDKGQGDPVIYPYHDYLFRAFIEPWERVTPEDILKWYSEGVLEERIGCEPGLVNKIFSTPKEFIEDLEQWWKLFNGIGLAKRIQSPPILAVSRRAYGFDYRESQIGTYFTKHYYDLKEKLLS